MIALTLIGLPYDSLPLTFGLRARTNDLLLYLIVLQLTKIYYLRLIHF